MRAWIFAFSRAAFAVNRDASSARDAAFAAAAIISSGAVGCWVGGILGDRWGRTRLTRLAMALSGTCCVLIGPVAATCPGERVVPDPGVITLAGIWGLVDALATAWCWPPAWAWSREGSPWPTGPLAGLWPPPRGPSGRLSGDKGR